MQDLELRETPFSHTTPVDSKLYSKSNQYDTIIELL